MKKETKSVNSGIITVSLFIICAAAVLWRRYGTDDLKNPAPAQPGRDSLFQQKRQFIYNSKVYLPAIRLTNNGDIVICQSKGLTDQEPQDINLIDTLYNISGIISRERDTVFVYYVAGSETEPDPKIIREPLWNFGSPKRNQALRLYRFGTDTVLQNGAVSIAQHFYQQQILSDTAFDMETKKSLLGAGLITYCFEKVSGQLFDKRSQANSKTHTATDDIISNKRIQKVAAWKY